MMKKVSGLVKVTFLNGKCESVLVDDVGVVYEGLRDTWFLSKPCFTFVLNGKPVKVINLRYVLSVDFVREVKDEG